MYRNVNKNTKFIGEVRIFGYIQMNAYTVKFYSKLLSHQCKNCSIKFDVIISPKWHVHSH